MDGFVCFWIFSQQRFGIKRCANLSAQTIRSPDGLSWQICQVLCFPLPKAIIAVLCLVSQSRALTFLKFIIIIIVFSTRIVLTVSSALSWLTSAQLNQRSGQSSPYTFTTATTRFAIHSTFWSLSVSNFFTDEWDQFLFVNSDKLSPTMLWAPQPFLDT